MAARRAYDVVVVGGGIVGLCIAVALRSHGVERVAIVEASSIASGTTSRGSGGVRSQFLQPVNVRLTLASREAFRHWAYTHDDDIGYVESGYVFLASTPEDLENRRQTLAVMREAGAFAEILGPDDLHSILPGVELGGVIAGLHSPHDGMVMNLPRAAAASLLRASGQLAVEILEYTRALGIQASRGRATAVRTTNGVIRTPCVIVAAGLGSTQLVEPHGLRLPVVGERGQVYICPVPSSLRCPGPFVYDMSTGAYFATVAAGLLFGGGNSREGDRSNGDEARRIVALLRRRLRDLSTDQITGGWTGIRHVSPDDIGIVGAIPHTVGLHVATGLGHHGFMHAPAVGEIVARQVVGMAPPFDVSAMAPSRFLATEPAI